MSEAENGTKQTTTPANAGATVDRRFSVAPMMDWTDRHCRYFLRLLSRHALLYTETVSYTHLTLPTKRIV